MNTWKKRGEREGGSSGSTLLNAANSRPSQAPANLISFLLCFLCFSLFPRGRAGDRNKRYKTKREKCKSCGRISLPSSKQVTLRANVRFIFSSFSPRGERVGMYFSSDLLRSIVSRPCYRRSAPRRVVASCRACVTLECRFCRSPMRSWPRVRASHRDDSIHPMLPSEGLFDNDKIVFTFREREIFILLRKWYEKLYFIFEIRSLISLYLQIIVNIEQCYHEQDKLYINQSLNLKISLFLISFI